MSGTLESAYLIAFAAVGFYVIFFSAAWIVGALRFVMTREGPLTDEFYDVPDGRLPSATILVPAYCEEKTIGACLDALREVDYPVVEVVAIDDGSTDGTAGVIASRMESDPRLRMVRKCVNEGKALALNDGLVVSSGEIVMVVDADAQLHPEALRVVAAHFVHLPRVGGVTGNPRPINTRGVLGELQVVEYASHVSLIRRAQVVWGRIMTMSGVVSAFRRSVLADVGVFDPSMSTEDIELTWRIQRRLYDVHYEPRAVLGMVVPSTLRSLVRQRMRWGRGVAEVLKRHAGILVHWRNRRHWPTYFEAVLSLIWWHLLVLLVLITIVLEAIGALGVLSWSPFPWGLLAVLSLAAVIQLFLGVLVDSHYDRSARRALAIVPLYPLFYWLVTGFASTMVTIPSLIRRRRPPNVKWKVER